MSLTATYDDTAAKVTLAIAAAPAGTAFAYVQQSPDGVQWNDVRGAQAVAVSGGTGSVIDYEYTAGVLNRYRVTYTKADHTSAGANDTATVTAAQTKVWLKNPLKPFLNRVVIVTGPLDDTTRDSRSGLFEIIGRTDAVGVTDLMTGMATSYRLRCDTIAATRDLEQCLASGDVVFFQPPNQTGALDTMYAVPGSIGRDAPAQTSQRRYVAVPLTQAGKPDPTLAAVQSTYQTVLNTYATYADLLAAKATYQDVLLLVGTAADVITI